MDLLNRNRHAFRVEPRGRNDAVLPQRNGRNREHEGERRRKSTARLVGALAVLSALSLLRLEPGSIRQSLYAMGRRALACAIGEIHVPEDYDGYYETSYNPAIDYNNDNRDLMTPPSTAVGYVVNIPFCPEDSLNAGSDPGRAFFDSMAMLKLNIGQAHEAGGNVYSWTAYAIIHPSAVECQGPDGSFYDRVAILEDLKFWVKVWGENVDTDVTDIDPAVKAAVDDDTATNDLSALNALTLDDHDAVVIMDQTTTLVDSPNDQLDTFLSDPDAQFMAGTTPPPSTPPSTFIPVTEPPVAPTTTAPSETPTTPAPSDSPPPTTSSAPSVVSNPTGPAPANTDYLLLKPNQTTFDDIQAAIQNSTYDPATDTDTAGVTGGAAGVLGNYIANNPNSTIPLDPCSYGDAVNDPACSENFTTMKVATLKESCGEPWNCNYDNTTMPAICADYISKWHQMRADFEDECFNSPVSVNNGTLEVDIFKGHCDDIGFQGYKIMLPDNAICFGDMHSVEDSKLLPGVLQTQTFSLVTQEYTGNGRGCVSGTITIPQYVPPFNIAIVIDVSGSTGAQFGGTPVGDLNDHAGADTILDAEIDSIIKMIQSMVDSSNLNNDNVDIELIRFSGTARSLGHWPPADPNDPTVINPQLYNRLTGMVDGGYTNFDDALDVVVEYFQDEAPFTGGSNLLFFLSDGKPNICGDGDSEYCGYKWNGKKKKNNYMSNNHATAVNYVSELAELDALGVHRTAIGVGTGSDVKEGSGLDKIHSDPNARPIKVLSSDQLVDVLTANPVEGTPLTLKVWKNGVIVPEIDITDMISGPTGFSFGPVILAGLDETYGATNVIEAEITMDLDGDDVSDVTFFTQSTVTGTVTNLAMTSRRRLSSEPESATKSICNIVKRSKRFNGGL